MKYVVPYSSLSLHLFSLNRPQGRFSLEVVTSTCVSAPLRVIVDYAQTVRVLPFIKISYPNDSQIRTYVLLLGISYYDLLTRVK